ncbi:MAG: Hsp20/alpha crystallin family protein [Elusimicrobiales bacterium]|jgi:HSP20 family protein|nr:Hsp20/alpha crystallin family protein [Elusimicrobiales bacterium]NLH38799.1 Hsp20/alpha crystallin family protein [Elusimicrobiota bacterium]
MAKELTTLNDSDIIHTWFDDIFDNEMSLPLMKIKNPKIDLKETEKEIIVNAEIPGVDKKDIKLDLNENSLTISYEKKMEKDEKNKGGWRIIERSYGSFARTIPLPQPVDENSAKATYKDGVLNIVLKKTKETKNNRITIE